MIDQKALEEHLKNERIIITMRQLNPESDKKYWDGRFDSVIKLEIFVKKITK
jgi:hypothetical protein